MVETAPVGTKDTYLWDTQLPRFGLRVTQSGARIYLVQYRVKPTEGRPSRTRRITIGQHERPWKIDAARDRARQILIQVDQGNDPFDDRREAAKHAARTEERRRLDTFSAVLDRYSALKKRPNRSWRETERLLRHGPAQAWGDQSIVEIRRPDVADLIDTIGQRSPSVARSTFAALRPLFRWAIERGLIEHSPCEALTAPARVPSRDRVLSDAELKEVWAVAGARGHPFANVIRILMLTGQRRAEVAGMRWSEIDFDSATWRIPAERTKNSKAHEIDLSPQVLKLLQEIVRDGDLIFASKRNEPVTGFSAVKRAMDKKLTSIGPWRIHDLRRTAATGMASLGFHPHVIERVLNHLSGAQGGLTGVYQRHTYRPERKAAMLAWGRHVEAVVTGVEAPPNVIQLRESK